MNTAFTSRSAAQGFRHALVHAAAHMASRATTVMRALRHRSEIRQLCAWDDSMLKDIGLTRSDVVGALSEPLFCDPSAALAARLGRRRGGARRGQWPSGIQGLK